VYERAECVRVIPMPLMLLLLMATAAAAVEYTWVGGSDLAGQPAVYAPPSAATPGARANAAIASDAQQPSVAFLFGGTVGALDQVLDDLWVLDLATHEWQWIMGSGNVSTAPGDYGIKGVDRPSNRPGARVGASAAALLDHVLLVFGGAGYDANGDFGLLSDMWAYDLDVGNWSWIAGPDVRDQAGDYGVFSVAQPTNNPGARWGAAMALDLARWRLLLFGGYGLDANGDLGLLNDVWSLSITTMHWAWIAGSDTKDALPFYFRKDFVSPFHVPGARHSPVVFVDAPRHRMLIFGGVGLVDAGAVGELADLWVFDLDLAVWKWQGSSAANASGVYGVPGVASAQNRPGGRMQTSWSLNALTGELVLFGGSGWDAHGQNGLLNDVWLFDLVSELWTWLGGNDTVDVAGVYGTLGVADDANLAGGRRAPFLSHTSEEARFVLFGGFGVDSEAGTGALNDLWSLELPFVSTTGTTGTTEAATTGVITTGTATTDTATTTGTATTGTATTGTATTGTATTGTATTTTTTTGTATTGATTGTATTGTTGTATTGTTTTTTTGDARRDDPNVPVYTGVIIALSFFLFLLCVLFALYALAREASSAQQRRR